MTFLFFLRSGFIFLSLALLSGCLGSNKALDFSSFISLNYNKITVHIGRGTVNEIRCDLQMSQDYYKITYCDKESAESKLFAKSAFEIRAFHINHNVLVFELRLSDIFKSSVANYLLLQRINKNDWVEFNCPGEGQLDYLNSVGVTVKDDSCWVSSVDQLAKIGDKISKRTAVGERGNITLEFFN